MGRCVAFPLLRNMFCTHHNNSHQQQVPLTQRLQALCHRLAIHCGLVRHRKLRRLSAGGFGCVGRGSVSLGVQALKSTQTSPSATPPPKHTHLLVQVV